MALITWKPDGTLTIDEQSKRENWPSPEHIAQVLSDRTWLKGELWSIKRKLVEITNQATKNADGSYCINAASMMWLQSAATLPDIA